MTTLRFELIKDTLLILPPENYSYIKDFNGFELRLDSADHVLLENCKLIEFETAGSAEFVNCTVAKVVAAGNLYFHNCSFLGGVTTPRDICFVKCPQIGLAAGRQVFVTGISGDTVKLNVETLQPVIEIQEDDTLDSPIEITYEDNLSSSDVD